MVTNQVIGDQNFTIVSYVRESDDYGCLVYITEEKSSVFQIYFRFTNENSGKAIFEEIVSSVEFDKYVNAKDIASNEPITYYTPGMFLDYQLGDSVFPDYVSDQIITINEVNGHLYADSADSSTIDSLYWVSANSNGNRQEIVDTAHERIISYFENRYGRGEQVKVPNGVFPRYWGFDDEAVTQFITESGLVYLVGPNSEYNIYVVQIEEPY